MKKTINKLESMILNHKELYYRGVPEITDEEFDKLETQLRELDPTNNTLNIIGNKKIEGEKVKHDHKILSLEKKNNTESLTKWFMSDDLFCVSRKIDGSNCSVVIQNGKIKVAKTRGDGVYGSNITSKIETVFSTSSINTSLIPDCIVYGEMCIKTNNFLLLQTEMQKRNLNIPTAQRNIVAGLLNREDNHDLIGYCDFIAHGIDIVAGDYISEHDKYGDLIKYGFHTAYIDVYNSTDLINELSSLNQKITEDGILCDGIVITIDDVTKHIVRGFTDHHPKYSVAYKFATETAVTKVTDITWNVGRTGKLTPLIHVEPTELSGCVISKATGHNAKFVEELRLMVGDEIEIRRSNEIIPQILRNINPDMPHRNGYVWLNTPYTCSSCREPLHWSDSRTDLFCINHDNCPEQIIQKLIHYASVMEMETISESTVRLLVEHGLVKTFYDFYKITVVDLLKLPKIKEKRANVIVQSINQSIRNWSDEKFVVALGLDNIGKNISKKLISGLQYIRESKGALLQGIDGIGETIYTSVLNNIDYICDSLETIKTQLGGLIMEEPKEAVKELIQGLKLSGKRFILSGSFSAVKREIEALIIENGGIIQSTVNKELDYLVSNENSTSKVIKANQLGKTVLTEEQLMEMIK